MLIMMLTLKGKIALALTLMMKVKITRLKTKGKCTASKAESDMEALRAELYEVQEKHRELTTAKGQLEIDLQMAHSCAQSSSEEATSRHKALSEMEQTFQRLQQELEGAVSKKQKKIEKLQEQLGEEAKAHAAAIERMLGDHEEQREREAKMHKEDIESMTKELRQVQASEAALCIVKDAEGSKAARLQEELARVRQELQESGQAIQQSTAHSQEQRAAMHEKHAEKKRRLHGEIDELHRRIDELSFQHGEELCACEAAHHKQTMHDMEQLTQGFAQEKLLCQKEIDSLRAAALQQQEDAQQAARKSLTKLDQVTRELAATSEHAASLQKLLTGTVEEETVLKASLDAAEAKLVSAQTTVEQLEEILAGERSHHAVELSDARREQQSMQTAHMQQLEQLNAQHKALLASRERAWSDEAVSRAAADKKHHDTYREQLMEAHAKELQQKLAQLDDARLAAEQEVIRLQCELEKAQDALARAQKDSAQQQKHATTDIETATAYAAEQTRLRAEAEIEARMTSERLGVATRELAKAQSQIAQLQYDLTATETSLTVATEALASKTAREGEITVDKRSDMFQSCTTTMRYQF